MHIRDHALRVYEEAKRRFLIHVARPVMDVMRFSYAASSLISMPLTVVAHFDGNSMASAFAGGLTIVSVTKDVSGAFMAPHHWQYCCRRVREWLRKVFWS